MSLDAVLARLDAGQQHALDRLTALLRIPSISTDPAHAPDIADAARWLAEDLTGIGIAAQVRPTQGHPMVVGRADGPGPHLLFYGHYDVQPVDPLDLWTHPPFEPRVTEDEIQGRGASDDKGQLLTFLEACRAWKLETGSLPCKLTVLLEGEEESGSPSLVPFLRDNAAELTADLALICDTGMLDGDTPSITTQLRGLMGEEIVLRGAERDLHSGAYGGPAANPIRVLAHILAALHDDHGRVTLPGFYDGVPEPDPDLVAQWAALSLDTDGFLAAVGLSHPAGEAGYSMLEQIWARPTLEFNGIAGGYAGAGFKTVLPAEARAKVSARLVADQDPEAIRAALRAHVRAMLPPDMAAEFHEHGGGRASVMRTDRPEFTAARQALSDEWPNPAAFVGGGGSIPIAGHFKTELGMDSMLIGFARDSDRIHSPNEKYDRRSFHKGARSWARILAALAA